MNTDEAVSQDVKQLEQRTIQLERKNKNLEAALLSARLRITNAKIAVTNLQGRRSFKLLNLALRIKNQLLLGSIKDKKEFFRWFWARIGKRPHYGRSYSPLTNVLNALGYDDGAILSNDSENRIQMLEEHYNKYDVIMLSIIDFDFRYQRPQHFAAKFANEGHRVFYVNAMPQLQRSINMILNNLYTVSLRHPDNIPINNTDWAGYKPELERSFDWLVNEHALRDAVVIIEYPNWVHAALYLREQFGFKIIVDYLDDFTGFENPDVDTIHKNNELMLKNCDAVIASSEFLFNSAKKYNNNVTIVRNAAEFEHFNKIAGIEKEKPKKVIGYYGAIADWFDTDKVCFLAKHLPDCDIELIGHVTAPDHKKLLQYENIKLLGEKPYAELPDYTAAFDVCLIPFLTTTDLIKATNPVKFYEYLSAGKKIVATEIPELMPYKDEYVYLANDNQQFLEYVKLCLSGLDKLKDKQSLIEMGRGNDWHHRSVSFDETCRMCVPKVSIIVLSYNNVVLTKACIDSILDYTAYARYELIIVDNNSQDETVAYLKKLESEAHPQVKIIFNDKNSGFAAGNNLGIAAADGDYIVLLNNDTIVTRGWLTAMIKHLENDPEMGMCGPVTNMIGNEAKIEVNYHSMKEMQEFSDEYTWNHMNEIFPDIGMLAFFCVAIKRELITKCGLLDEAYTIGMFEDDDYSEACRRAGYKLCIAEDSFVHHSGNASFAIMENKELKILWNTNKKIFEDKWKVSWTRPKFRDGVTLQTNNTSVL